MDHGSASGPLDKAVQLSISQLTPGDIQAIVIYPPTVPPIQTSAPPPMAGPAPAGGHVFMPAFASSYTNAEIAAVANYVSARFGAAPSQLTAQDVAKLRND